MNTRIPIFIRFGWCFTLYLLLTILLTALFTPWLFAGMHSLGLANNFAKVVMRSLELTALFGLIGLLWGLGHWGWKSWGYGGRIPHFGQKCLLGMGLGLLMIGAWVICLILLGIRSVHEPLPELGEGLSLIALVGIGAMLTAVIEETLFRGGLYSALAVGTGHGGAILLSALIFAGAHFLDPTYRPLASEVEWSSGFAVLSSSLKGFSGKPWWDSFLALWVTGLLLAIIRWRTGSIAIAIGMHAGWVVAIRVTKKLTLFREDAQFSLWVSQYDGIIGYGTVLWFSLCAMIAWLVLKRRTPS